MTATLVRGGLPVVTAVHLPPLATTYTALLGGGASHDGRPMSVSTKTDLRSALVGTGQASPRETSETFRLLGRSVPAMLDAALVVRMSVPTTLQLIEVAAGRTEAFWQHSAVRSGLLAGALLVTEAGGTITDLHGEPWTLSSSDFLAAAPGVHAQALEALEASTEADAVAPSTSRLLASF